MNELFKIIGIGIVALVAYLIVKQIKPDIALFVSLVGGCIILILTLNGLSEIISTIKSLVEKTGINSNIFVCILKIIGIGYLIEFAISLCTDAGCSSLSDKIALGGKVCILVVSLPIISNLLNIIIEILP